ncbi:MAG: hypothetical protein ACM3Q2_12685 [Syntrophothermus sp.]
MKQITRHGMVSSEAGQAMPPQFVTDIFKMAASAMGCEAPENRLSADPIYRERSIL